MLFTLASLIFYGGAGVNLINYCCGDCLKTGIEAVVTKDCCSTHNHDTETRAKEEMPLSINGIHDCGIERIEFSWTAEDTGRIIQLQPLVTDVLFPASFNSLLIEPVLDSVVQYVENNPPPILPPREYLAQLTVLLI